MATGPVVLNCIVSDCLFRNKKQDWLLIIKLVKFNLFAL